MDLRKKVKKGFTLIELMVVIVIIGILVAIALPNFISAQDRAKVSSVKSNMHTVQTMIETYAVDWGGVYATKLGDETAAATAEGLMTEAKNKNYGKAFKNPFTAKSGAGEAYMASPPTAAVPAVANGKSVGTAANMAGGAVSYDPQAVAGTITKYFIYGGDKDPGSYIVDKGQVLNLTNQ